MPTRPQPPDPNRPPGRIPTLLRGLLQKEVSRRGIRNLVLAAAALLCLGLGFGFAALQYLSRDLPSPASIESVEPPVKTVVLAADGDTLREFYRENRTLVPLSRIPRRLQEAVIATEDRRFYDHWGIDPRRILKIIWVNLTSQRRPGASTLTQQLARNLFLTPEKTLTRKLREIVLALQIEQTYTKDEILTMYLNQIYLGRGAYGMQAAARTYFGKDVWDLSDGESAMLAGIIQNPGHHSPVYHLDQSYRRRATVLQAMIDSGYLSPAEAESIGATRVTVVDPDSIAADAGFAAYFVEEVRQELERRYGVEGLYSRGLRVTTTLVPRYQRWLEEAAESHLQRLEEEQRYPMTRARYDSLVAAGQAPETVDYLQGAGLMLDVRTGAVLAMMGGRSFRDSKWNRAVQAPRQPGSIFKPFVYLTALQHGYTPATILMDTPFVVDTGTGLWRPKNFSERFEGPVSVRYALSHSINTPTAKLYLDFGLAPVLENARRLGVTSELPRVPSLFLGAGELTLQEVATAYSTFANAGVRTEPYLIDRVETADGEILYEARIRQHEVLDPAVAYVLTDMLGTTLREGTGQSSRRLGFRVTGAGKTGTTNDCTNAWFCGYTPSFCAGVWVGFEQNVSLGRAMTGARAALPIWAGLMSRVAAEKGDEPFPRPASIVERTICARSGQLAASRCDSLRQEIFLPDNYPREICELHGGQLHDLTGFDKDFETLDESHSGRGF